MTLAPPLAEFLSALNQPGVPSAEELGVEALRAGELAFALTFAGDEVEVGSVEESVAGGVPVRVYRAPDAGADEVGPTVVYLHGGGWVTGSIDTHDRLCRRLCRQAGTTVVSVGYRLAPEHPFPTPLVDAYAAVRWSAKLHPGTSLVVAGDSAGANLAAALCLHARDDSGPVVRGQILLYPALDAACDTPSFAANASGYLLHADTMRWFWREYLSGGAEASDPLVSPLRAIDLDRLPPALIVTAEFDPLRDEGESYARRLQEGGVDVTLRRYDGMIHGFAGMPALVSEAEQAIDDVKEFLCRIG